MRIQKSLNSDVVDGVRRVHALAGDREAGAQVHGTEHALGRALEARPRGKPERAVRHRAGKRLRGIAGRIPESAEEHPIRRLCHRRPCRGRTRRGPIQDHESRPAGDAGGQAQVPDGHGHAGGPDRGRARRRGHVRLRAAHAQRAQRLALHALGRRQDPQREVARRCAPAGRGLRLLRLPELLARLPVPPAEGERDPRRAPQHHPQPALLPGPDAATARGDRGRAARADRRAPAGGARTLQARRTAPD